MASDQYSGLSNKEKIGSEKMQEAYIIICMITRRR